MRILALDSSATQASVAILDDNVIIGEFFINTKLTHSTTLIAMCNALLENTQTDISTIDAYAVNAGPGSFTGVRIGVAGIKGMAWTANKPCVSISTLDCIAQNLKGTACVICAVMDARCNQFYNSIFSSNCKGEIVKLCNDRALSYEELTNELLSYSDKRIILCGDGANIAYKLMSEKITNLEVASTHLIHQRAFGVGVLAQEKLLKNEYTTAKELMPVYLRLPQAQRDLKKKQSKGVN